MLHRLKSLFKRLLKLLVKRLAWFVGVGCAAALTHWLVAVFCVETLGLPPLLANAAGWLVAFNVSLFGHYHLSFRHRAASFRQAALRFFGVAALAFACNELAYAALLHVSSLAYDVALVLVLVLVAVLTFVLSRWWAFTGSKG